VEVEIGMPTSWWQGDQVEGYKKRLTQSIVEIKSSAEVLQGGV
jgi:hypothetical protein